MGGNISCDILTSESRAVRVAECTLLWLLIVQAVKSFLEVTPSIHAGCECPADIVEAIQQSSNCI